MNHLPHTFEQVTRRGALSRAARRTSAMLAVGLATAATITLAPTFGVNAGAQDGPAQENVALAFESPLEDVSPDVLKVTALATLGDERGWVRAGFTFTEDESSPNRILLAEPDATAALCAGADADGTIGCQRETIVVINAAAAATPRWLGRTRDLPPVSDQPPRRPPAWPGTAGGPVPKPRRACGGDGPPV